MRRGSAGSGASMLSNNEGRRNDLERAIVAVADPDARPRPAGQNWRKMPATEATLDGAPVLGGHRVLHRG